MSVSTPSAVRDDPRVRDLLRARERRLSDALTRAGVDVLVTDNPIAGIWLDLDPGTPTLVVDRTGWVRLDPECGPVADQLARSISPAATVGTEVGSSHELVVAVGAGARRRVNATAAFREARAVKDGLELSVMRRAFAIAEAAAREALAGAAEGRLELDIAQAFERSARLAGADGQSYELSVATGDRTSRPWAGVTTRELEHPGAFQVDLGVWLKRYRADVSYARWLGDPGHPAHRDRYARWRSIYDGARAVHDAVLEKVRPGIHVGELAAAASEATSRALARVDGSSAPHLPAHGLGLEVHEEPFARPSSTLVLEPGMVLSVEPGLYLPDLGARTETVVVVTDAGWDPLTTEPVA